MNCKVMGIVNVTPDSFSDGGKFNTPEEAIRRARNLVEEGADIIDIGGESTRPGSTPLTWKDEWARIEPVLEGVARIKDERKETGTAFSISVDTYHPETAAKAVAAGMDIVNCVCPESVPSMLKLLEANPSLELVLPASCYSKLPNFPTSQLSNLYLDPMIGFDTTREEDLRLLQTIPDLAKLGRVLIGASRKRIVKKLTGEKGPGKDLAGNLTIAVWAALNGASVIRVHDVRETVQALKVLAALKEGPLE